MGRGDVLLVMWGREARRSATRGFDGFSGLHAECLPWLHDREVAVLGSDGISDPMPFVGTPSGRSRCTRSGSPPWACT